MACDWQAFRDERHGRRGRAGVFFATRSKVVKQKRFFNRFEPPQRELGLFTVVHHAAQNEHITGEYGLQNLGRVRGEVHQSFRHLNGFFFALCRLTRGTAGHERQKTLEIISKRARAERRRAPAAPRQFSPRGAFLWF